MDILKTLHAGGALKGKSLDIPGEIKFLLDVDGFQKITLLYTALTLGIFNALARRRFTASQLARTLSLRENIVSSLLGALRGLGYLECKKNVYALSHFSAVFLVAGREQYLGDYINIFIDTWGSWLKLAEVVRSGKPVPGMGLKGNRGKAVLRYYAAANEVVRQAAGQLLDRIDLKNVRRVICGEVGLTFLQELLKRKPDIRYTLACLKDHKRFFPALLRRFPLPRAPEQYIYSDRGNALRDSWGGKGAYDLVFLYRKLAFYSYGDQFLKKSYRVLSDGGMVIVCEPTTDSLLHFMRWILDAIQLMDYMIAGTLAPRLMSSGEIEARLQQIGFKKTETIATMWGMFNFVIGRK